MTIEIVYRKNNPKEKFAARYTVRQDGKDLDAVFILDSDNAGRGARKAALKQAQDFCKMHFQIIPEHRGSDRYTLTSVAPVKAEKPAKVEKPSNVTAIDKKQLKGKLQSREVKHSEIPASAAARVTPDRNV